MLISRVGEGIESGGGGGEGLTEATDHGDEYQTASELFDLMTNNCGFDIKGGEGLTSQDLVLLYQNIDIGTKLMNSANEAKKPNQYVETIVYNGDVDSDSDDSDEDIPNVFKINQERLNFFNNASFENLLCHKLGGVEIQMSDLSTATLYKRHFFKDPFVKKQLINMFDVDSTFLPTSLLDYICCKRLEENNNMYIDNIITHVQKTIEQLKRISNGDYLTDRTKEKWREVTGNFSQEISKMPNTACTPLRAGHKKGNVTTWNDIVHSAIDVRSLSKILKKKIVVEIPKLICGSFRLFGKLHADNLIISCKKENDVKNTKNNESDEKSQLDVVLKINRSETGQITARVSSVKILQIGSDIPTKEPMKTPEILPSSYIEEKEVENETDCEATYTLSIEGFNEATGKDATDPLTSTGDVDQGSLGQISHVDANYSESDCYGFYDVAGIDISSNCSSGQKDTTEKLESKHIPEGIFNLLSTDELRITMKKLSIQTALPEESSDGITRPIKKKSQQKIRIKSPYENKLSTIEEKKRKRLLEIREKREKKKQAFNEHCKITKNKYGKTYTVQPANSVTKLSITNKSFYNSIYGQTSDKNLEDKSSSCKTRNSKKSNPLALDVFDGEMQNVYESPNVTPKKYGKQFINRSYYLDEAETEVDMQMKQCDNNNNQTYSASTSTINTDFHPNIDLFNNFIGPSVSNFEKIENFNNQDIKHNNSINNISEIIDLNKTAEMPEVPVKVRQRSLKKVLNMKDTHDSKIPVSTMECRKSIDKLYDLMGQTKPSKVNFEMATTNLCFDKPEVNSTSTGQDTSSGTSLRNNLTFSNPSLSNVKKTDNKKNQSSDKSASVPVVPKVIVNSKHGFKIDAEKLKKDRKKLNNHPIATKGPENPLKAISQLLHEFDHAQKTRHQFTPDNKGPKKVEIVSNEGKNINRPFRDGNMKRRSRFDQHLNTKDIEQDRNKPYPHRERRRPAPPVDIQKNLFQGVEEKYTERSNIVKNKLMDIIEEVKEARGEAIRGPSKRLNTLAQPKKIYVQAHSEDYQSKYGRNLIADRLQRLAGGTSTSKSDRYIGSVNSKLKARQNVTEALSNDVAMKSVSAQPLQNTEKPFRPVPPNHISAVPHRSSPRDSTRAPARTMNRAFPVGSPPHSPVRSNSGSPTRSSPQSQRLSPHRKIPPPVTCMNSIPESPEVRRKMVAVESYVNNHYGNRVQSPRNTQMLLTGHKSRVPFVPKDMTAVLAPSSNAGESNELGSTMKSVTFDINSPQGIISDTDLKIIDKNQDSKSGTHTDSDFIIDVFEDIKVETAVENLENNKLVEVSESLKYEIKSLNSKTELEKLESAIYNQMSGALQKRLRIKNLTLTPKQSMQKVYLLQSGDTGALFVNSLTKIEINKCNDNLQDMKPLPMLLNNNLKFDFMQIPEQHKTVGFALTNHHIEKNKSLSNIQSVSGPIESRRNTGDNNTSDKVIQCFKGVPENYRQENATQAVVDNKMPEMISVSVDINSTENAINYTTPNNANVLLGTDQIALSKKDKSKNEKPKNNINVNNIVLRDNNSVKDAIVTNINSTNIKNENFEDDNVIKDSNIPSMVQTSNVDGVKTLDEKPKYYKSTVSEKSASAEYTSSLDMLVGLLNEIQKITCQTQLCSGCTDLNTMLIDAATRENKDKVSQEPRVGSSLLKKLEPKPSIYSLYISAKDCMYSSSHNINIDINKSLYVDKEVNADIEKDLLPAFTEASSKIYPITINHSTSVTTSLFGVLSKPSRQSMYSFDDYQLLCSNKIFESQSMKNIEISPKDDKENFKISLKYTLENSKITSIAPAAAAVVPVHNNDSSKFKVNKFIENYKEFDPILKIKRDILVTMYSILVLTVFAALSFPELMMIST